MPTQQMISGISIKALLRTVGPDKVDVQELARLCGCLPGESFSEECWVTQDNWYAGADYLRELYDGGNDLYFEAGRRCGEYKLLGSLEFLPWFLSTPALLMHNIEIVLADLDTIVEPKVEFISSDTCRLILLSRTGKLPPGQYIDFLLGYLIATLELWDSKIGNCNAIKLPEQGCWQLSLSWKPHEYRHRRAMEELMVEPEFFGELYEGLRRIKHRGRGRFSELIQVSEELRGAARQNQRETEQKPETPPPLKTRYLDLLTPLYDGIILVDRAGAILDANPAALTMLGFSDMPHLLSAYPDISSLVGARSGSAEEVLLELARNQREQIFNFRRQDEMHAELLIFAPDGAEETSDEKIRVVLRDPAFRFRHHSELGRSRQFLEAIFLNNPAGLQVIDTEGWTVRVNPRLITMFNLDPNRLVGVGRYNILRDRAMERTGLVEELRKALHGAHVVLSEFRLNPVDTRGSAFYSEMDGPMVFNLTAYPLKDHKGSVYNVVVSYTDITESYLIQQQLSQLDKLQSIGTLTSGIAHDFNNILGAIVPNADLIMQLAKDNDIVRRKAEAIKTASKRAAALTRQLVSFARESHSDKRYLNLNTCVREAVELIGNAIPKNVSIDFEPFDGLPAVIADPLQMQQVLINLIINASDAQPQGGIIAIHTQPQELQARTSFGGNIIAPGHYARLSVSDHGTGIPPEVVGRVFDPFFTTKEKGRGTGLGLSIVYSIVKNHKGLIDINTSSDVGTRVDVFLPVAETHSEAEPGR